MAREQTSNTYVTNQNPASMFGIYEHARILVPGLYFAVLVFLFHVTFLSRFFVVMLSGWSFFLVFFSTAIIAGLTMYAKEAPKRRRAFQENQPSQYLSSKARTMKEMPLLDDSEARRLYFYILNNHIPPAFYEKIFFFGTVYHIMIQIRRTSFWFGLVTLAASAYGISLSMPPADQQGLLVFSGIVWLVYVLNIRYNKADRKMQENYQDQILWMQMNNPLIESILRKRQSFLSQ